VRQQQQRQQQQFGTKGKLRMIQLETDMLAGVHGICRLVDAREDLITNNIFLKLYIII
jgi:hypothetical protein